MQTYFSAAPTAFTFEPTVLGSGTCSGTLYRAIPHSSDAPLASNYSLAQGGRWNPAASFPVIYTGASQQVVRSYLDWRATFYGVPLCDYQPEDLPDLVVMSFTGTVADVATDSGLVHYGLPVEYPVGYPAGQHAATQPIGLSIFKAGFCGIVTRSATVTSWNDPIHRWAEVAIFATQSPQPQVLERIPFADWYEYA